MLPALALLGSIAYLLVVTKKATRPWWHWLLIGCGSVSLLGVLAVGLLFYVAYKAVMPPDEAVCQAVIDSGGSLTKARAGFETQVAVPRDELGPPPLPPNFELLRYRSGSYDLHGYVSKPSTPGKHPVMVWLVGGYTNGVGDTPWSPAAPDNDQSAAVFRNHGLLTMYPVRRGADGNPGHQEALYGEVDDVINATLALHDLAHVDRSRIYLGGHSTGGTLALLAAAARSDLFRVVFAFGPVADVGSYGSPWSDMPDCERELRSPMWFMSSIRTPTWVIEGSRGNALVLPTLKERAGSGPVKVLTVNRADHFTVLYPASNIIGRKLAADTGPDVTLTLSEQELMSAVLALKSERAH